MSMCEWTRWKSLACGLSEDEVALYSLAVDDHDSNKDSQVDQDRRIDISDGSAVSDCSDGKDVVAVGAVLSS